jgi:hypothetical protein
MGGPKSGIMGIIDQSLSPMINIPDSLGGAILISIIDFLLSFLIISGIGVVLALLPLVNRRWKLDEARMRDSRH